MAASSGNEGAENTTPARGAVGREPYTMGVSTKWPFPAKAEVKGHLVVISKTRFEGRDTSLIIPYSRAVLKYEIHELIVTDEPEIQPGGKVHSTATLGFFQVDRGGMLAWGDEVWVGERFVGELAGFDLTHFPNHLNIVLRSEARVPGIELGLKLGERVRFTGPGVVEVPDVGM